MVRSMVFKIEAALACLLALGMFASGNQDQAPPRSPKAQSPRSAADLWGPVLVLNEKVAAELNLNAEQIRQIRTVVETVDVKYIDDLERVRTLRQNSLEEKRAKGEQER